MTDEAAAVAVAVAVAAIGTTATLTPLIVISYDIGQLTSLGVIQKINECVSLNKQIKLEMKCNDRFEATGAMQNTIVENSRHIKNISMFNICRDTYEHTRCFNFFITIVQGVIGNGKHLSYLSYRHEFELEEANQLADALRSNNNNNCSIESFDFIDSNLTPETIQPLLAALLDSGIRTVVFGNDHATDPPIYNNNNNINFTGMETNESLIELDLSEFYMREEDYQSLFISMKVNKGVTKLELAYDTYEDFLEEMKRLFEEMMCENITLLDCILYGQGIEEDTIYEMIKFQMELNRMWKRYIVKRENEKKTPAVITRIEEGDDNDNDKNNNNEEEERKKRLKMRFLLHLFMKKPVMRDTIIFNLLREYPDDLMDTDFHFRMAVHARDDDDRGNNDRGDDTNSDSDDDTDDDDVDSDSDDGTTGIL